MSEPAKAPAQAPARDPTQEVALQIYVQLCGQVYSATGTEKPQPKALVALSFKLAEAFEAGNLEFNPVARAAREAKDKAAVTLDSVQIDFASIGKPK